jgi:hypothetical protein
LSLTWFFWARPAGTASGFAAMDCYTAAAELTHRLLRSSGHHRRGSGSAAKDSSREGDIGYGLCNKRM